MSAPALADIYAEIAQIVARYAKEDAIESPIEGLFIVKRSSPTQPLHAHQRPSFWLVAQGRKCVKLGD
uniref:AraC family transcriptional regulator N-terminal domain-containing protein n=1 Tax=uncultured Caulobacter sp. TaxID=158749 RepID=UPI0025E9846F